MSDAGLIEHVARYLWLDHVMWTGFPNGLSTWDEMHEGNQTKEAFRSNARAAVEAYRGLPYGALHD